MGDEGGFAPELKNTEHALQILKEAIGPDHKIIKKHILGKKLNYLEFFFHVFFITAVCAFLPYVWQGKCCIFAI